MQLSERSFNVVADVFHRVSGIRLVPAKRQLVIGRLQKLATEKGLSSLDEYVDKVIKGGDESELVRVVDRLTTNETYFFREPAHFEFLADLLSRRRPGQEFRVWSAASSSGEEAYSIAMLLADKIGPSGWKIVGTDLSTAMVDAARKALYPMERARNTSPQYLKRFCMRGSGPYEGQLLVNKELRANVSFEQANLMQPLPDIGKFDVVFLRNVLIYFEPDAKLDIVRRVAPLIKPGGFLFTGHSESLSNLPTGLTSVKPAVYART
ncbi:MAG TPA: protein-glutamate O-methyltransferase CheR [Aquabacterium sp.]|uniref:CheR family methyltransferase n=1 Tax=Aquabacterium sp. TaxID=1872578 RepID=UPI002E37F3F8|nr:protein-glutamate O-methyltransferase CheR [Aquabacterium sp.]HEX5354669.1 protein-glutamate O-methyltransferase CheR [Aquabacterium sp.]